ncbi:hypothetical protein Mext_0871 [Methylorubrum extorquens PA1]|nr:hypothetical protein Mext_0871 [Methylorubrum extorquens PA1]
MTAACLRGGGERPRSSPILGHGSWGWRGRWLEPARGRLRWLASGCNLPGEAPVRVHSQRGIAAMRRFAIAAAGLMLCLMPIAGEAQAQGIPGGMRRGAAEGDRVAGPIGGIVGGAVGGAVGGVNGVLGIDPGRRAYRTRMRSNRPYHHRRYHPRHHRHR